VDVGRINGRLFINNVSLGVYAQMLGDPGYRQDKLRVAQTKLRAAFSDPQLRGLTPAKRHRRFSAL
jgi:diacylglycerol kinase family enzyme